MLSILRECEKNSKLLKDHNIKNIVIEIISGFELKDIVIQNGVTCVLLDDSEYNIVSLTICDESLIFKLENDEKIEIKTIKEGPFYEEVCYEKRPYGVIITKVNREYGDSIFFKDDKVVVDLVSKRFVIGISLLNVLFPEFISMGECNIQVLYKKLSVYEEKLLKDISSHVSVFETHMSKLIQLYNGKRIKNVSTSTCTYLNSQDISWIYDIVDGPDKLLRIYDLYNGVINERNIEDIIAIHQGLLCEESFGFKDVAGVTAMEDFYVSKSITIPSDKENGYVYNLLSKHFEILEEIDLHDRNSILEAICYVPLSNDRVKEMNFVNKILKKVGLK